MASCVVSIQAANQMYKQMQSRASKQANDEIKYVYVMQASKYKPMSQTAS
jgi:hypothetical protein